MTVGILVVWWPHVPVPFNNVWKKKAGVAQVQLQAVHMSKTSSSADSVLLD